eukprot:g1536.t1
MLLVAFFTIIALIVGNGVALTPEPCKEMKDALNELRIEAGSMARAVEVVRDIEYHMQVWGNCMNYEQRANDGVERSRNTSKGSCQELQNFADAAIDILQRYARRIPQAGGARMLLEAAARDCIFQTSSKMYDARRVSRRRLQMCTIPSAGKHDLLADCTVGKTIVVEPSATLTIEGNKNGLPQIGLKGSAEWHISTHGVFSATRVEFRDGYSFNINRFLMPYQPAGSVTVYNGTAAFETVIFYSNVAKSGGAVNVHNGMASFNNCTFQENTAHSGHGGAVFLYPNTKAVFNNTKFLKNIARGGNGGGVYVQKGAEATFQNCILEENSADIHGGAIVIEHEAT